jgi:hypothetical protein
MVFDPFAGSGSAIALASYMERSGIAFDINPNYKRLFKSEVIIAAKKYWDKRNKENEERKTANKRFRLKNIALRKLKSTFLLLNAIDKKRKFKIILTTTDPNSNKVHIILNIPDGNSENLINKIKTEKLNIERKMKTNVEIKIFSSLGFQRKIN